MRYIESLVIRLLGIPEIRLGEQPLTFRTRKVLALLVYLVAEQGMLSRESLMTILWPENSQSSAAASLRTTLSRLRKALGPVGDVLVTEAGNVGFDSNYTVDLDLEWLRMAAKEDTPPDELRSLRSPGSGSSR